MTKTAAAVAAINAALLCLMAFGVDITTAQVAAIGVVANAVMVSVAAFLDPKVPWIGNTEVRKDAP